MSDWFRNNTVWLALILYCLVWLLLHPSLGYLLDSDAVAYLTIAHRAADGEWVKSINGLWSPLNSWLLIPFIKLGFDSWMVSKIMNACFGGVLLLLSNTFFKRIALPTQWVRLLTFILVPILVFYSYFQMFGDVLMLVLTMIYILLVIKKDFLFSQKKIVTAAVVMGVAYYAKSYALVLFCLHFSFLFFAQLYQNSTKRKTLFLNYILGIGIVFLMVLPRTYQIYTKYDLISLTGLSGKLNMSWHINSGKTFKEEIKLIVPPAYEDSPSFWEDPSLSHGKMSTPFESAHNLGRWILRVGYNCFLLLKSYLLISVFSLVLLGFLFYDAYRARKIAPLHFKLLSLLLVLPIGYLAIVVETRYVWLSTFLLMALGVKIALSYFDSKNVQKILLIFCLSFLIHPCYMLFQLQYKNKNLFDLAGALKSKNVHGKIVSNINDEGSLWVVSYLAELQNYTIEHPNYDFAELSTEMRRYNIQQYLHFKNEGGRFKETDSSFTANLKVLAKLPEHNATLYLLKD
jgi:hypothetical protein